MRSVFREDHSMFRDQARRFVDREIVPYLHEWEKAGIVPKEVWLKAGKPGCCAPQCLRNMAAPVAILATAP